MRASPPCHSATLFTIARPSPTAKATQVLSLLALVAAGCHDYRQYYFDGRVYDGVTGANLTKYSIELQYLDRTLKGTVDKDGRYFIGALQPYQDYTIVIRAEGYRPFLSHNVMRADPSPKVDQSQYFERGTLYPTAAVAPAATVHVTFSDSQDLPSGSIVCSPSPDSLLVHTAADAGRFLQRILLGQRRRPAACNGDAGVRRGTGRPRRGRSSTASPTP